MTGYRANRISVFAGPSLAGWAAAPPFHRLPPAGTGDMLALLAGPPHTVVLIDGVFGSRPAVWHKEILLLLARGFRVIGAASMGALRAAELDRFGMIGCGAIYRAYADGRITADDEVAVLHAPAALGGAPLSLAQVNVRATLCRAVRARVMTADAARAMRAASAAIHYRDRDWVRVLATADHAGFAAWTHDHAIDIKALDARAALAMALQCAPTAPPRAVDPPQTPFLLRLVEAVAARNRG
jgi:hypothetical protein